MGDNILPWIVALGGATGIGLLLREITSVITLLRKGVSAKEDKRKIDIVQQRDRALRREAEANVRFEHEAAGRRRVQEYASQLRRKLFEKGVPLDELESFPEQHTLSREEVDKIIKENSHE